eukprot:952631-Rhodomonas_salina.1
MRGGDCVVRYPIDDGLQPSNLCVLDDNLCGTLCVLDGTFCVLDGTLRCIEGLKQPAGKETMLAIVKQRHQLDQPPARCTFPELPDRSISAFSSCYCIT